ncbi:hypothetical protein GCM10010358_83910 [Streptomyces minutiscleroticus]|uniref:Transposase n=1 Tax=Streptomyces minutiscleroticus TaxID=68238 RepID=A0A918P4X8_9ACTN|nr:hypothetical protein GCM10010358_83910 [Streptomyces minutiscleroticus]
MPEVFGPWSTVYGRFRVWRDAGVFTARLEGLIAEAARRGRTDLSLVGVGSTTMRARHDAAGMLVGQDVMEVLEEAAAEQERTRQKRAAKRNTSDSPAKASASGRSADASADGTGSVCSRPCSAAPAAG